MSLLRSLLCWDSSVQLCRFSHNVYVTSKNDYICVIVSLESVQMRHSNWYFMINAIVIIAARIESNLKVHDLCAHIYDNVTY